MKYSPRLPLPTHIFSDPDSSYSSYSDCEDWLDDDGLYTCGYCGHQYDGNAQCFCFGICDEVSPGPVPPPGTPKKKRPMSKDRFEEEQSATTIQRYWRGYLERFCAVQQGLEPGWDAAFYLNESLFDKSCRDKFRWIVGHTYSVGDIIKYTSGKKLLIARVTKVNKKSIRKETGELGWHGDFTSWNVKCGTTKDNLQTITRKIWKLQPVEDPPQQITFNYDDDFQDLLLGDDEENNYGRCYS